MRKIRFYTFPPTGVYWPFILINANRPDFKHLSKFRSRIRGVIIDSGVEMFRDPHKKEYPGGPEKWIRHMIRIYIKAREYGVKEVYLVVPDYPDDYVEDWKKKHNLWVGEKTNVDRTIDNILLATRKYSRYPWIIPIQGFYMRPSSIGETIDRLFELGVLDDWDYVGIANLCTTRNTDIIYRAVRIAYSKLGDKYRIHVFGPNIRVLRDIKRYIYSFDAISFSKPIGRLRRLGYKWSCKTQEERRMYFYAWVETLKNKYGVSLA